jgi:predicted outer membrane repeat protein
MKAAGGWFMPFRGFFCHFPGLFPNIPKTQKRKEGCEMKIPKILGIFIGLAFLISGAAYGAIIHVPGDYPTIKLAIEAAVDGDTVLVGPGTYCEDDGEFLGKAITVKSEAGPDVTTIDMTGPCDLNFSGGETEETILEGFTILEVLDISGNTSPTIKNCKLIGSGCHGGGGHGSIWGGSSPTFINSQIMNGCAGVGGGYDISNSSATFIDCEFSNNEAGSNGGALYINNSSVRLEKCAFFQNSAGVEGGAISLTGSSTLSISFCNFSENSAQVGGGILNGYDDNTTISNSIFTKNTAEKWGGAIFANASTSFKTENCIFTENNANWHGGAIHINWSASPTITNSIFDKNIAGGGGGAIWIQPGSISNITNCTFFKNIAGWKGGAILNSDSNPTISNSILWKDNAPEGPEIGEYKNSDPDPTVNYCDIQGGYPGNGNINADPLFVDPDNADFHLQMSSPCIDTGTSENAPDTDIDGDSRPYGAGYDIGADEYVVSDTDGDGIPDDEDACPFSNLSDTVVIDGCDSNVDNLLFDDGCTISDLISQCAEDADNHGEFVSSVSHTTNYLKKIGKISGNEKGKIQNCAANADIP